MSRSHMPMFAKKLQWEQKKMYLHILGDMAYYMFVLTYLITSMHDNICSFQQFACYATKIL